MGWNFLTTNLFGVIGTFITVFVPIAVTIFLYFYERGNRKRESAKIILQEIRRGEAIISGYKESGQYKFTKKIIATNSWAKNIHYFVKNLEQDERDKISDLYSTGEYLDTIIAKVSDVYFDDKVEVYKKEIEEIVAHFQTPSKNQTTAAVNEQSGSQVISQNTSMKMPIIPAIPLPWKNLLDEVSYKYEPIYHSNICAKLKAIAKI